MTLVAGSYERFLFGLAVEPPAPGAGGGAGGWRLARAFTHAAHKGAVKCLAAGGPLLASGGADDTVHVYDLRSRPGRDLGFLLNPGEGAVTAAAFFAPAGAAAPTHLLTGAADGGVTVWRAGGGWEPLKAMRGHRGRVAGVAVHPSGRAALSVGGADGHLKMWDLVKGRCTFTARLGVAGDADGVAWAPGAAPEQYALHCGALVTVHSAAADAAAGPVHALRHARRATAVAWVDAPLLATGCEDGSLRLWDGGAEALVLERAHATRIRALAAVRLDGGGGGGNGGGGANGGNPPVLLASASSDGVVKLWRLARGARGGGWAAECLCSAETGARLTALAFVEPPEALAAAAAEAKLRRRGSIKKKRRAAAAEAAAGGAAAAGAAPAAAAARGAKAGKRARPADPVAAAATTSGAAVGGVVDFTDEQDARRAEKKRRAVALQASRLAGKGAAAHKRGARGGEQP